MIDINLHTVLTLNDNKKYIVVSKIQYEGSSYDYLLQLSADCENVTDQVIIVKEELEDGKMFILEIEDQKQLDLLVPLFCKQLESQ